MPNRIMSWLPCHFLLVCLVKDAVYTLKSTGMHRFDIRLWMATLSERLLTKHHFTSLDLYPTLFRSCAVGTCLAHPLASVAYRQHTPMRRLVGPYYVPLKRPVLKISSYINFWPKLRSLSFTSHRRLAQVHSNRHVFPEIYFTACPPQYIPISPDPSPKDSKPPDERTLRLGKCTSIAPSRSSEVADQMDDSALKTLQTRLPTLFESPLPQEILSPHITLHLFPSTHPHLPTASGRVAYHAALWTSPVAWGRMPLVGNVKLAVLSERVVKHGFDSYTSTPTTPSSRACSERLIVRWKTCGKTKGKGTGALYRGIGGHEGVDKITEWLGGDVRGDEEFCGLFIFDFDEQGRVLTHTIEHAEQTNIWDRTSRVVSVTDWLLGRMNGRGLRGKEPELAWNYVGEEGERRFKRRGNDV